MMTELKRAGGNELRDLRSSHWKNCAADTSSIETVLTPAFSAARLLRQASSITAAGVM